MAVDASLRALYCCSAASCTKEDILRAHISHEAVWKQDCKAAHLIRTIPSFEQASFHMMFYQNVEDPEKRFIASDAVVTSFQEVAVRKHSWILWSSSWSWERTKYNTRDNS